MRPIKRPAEEDTVPSMPKRVRPDRGLMPEAEFIAGNPLSFQVAVQAPVLGPGAKFDLQGQRIVVDATLTEKVLWTVAAVAVQCARAFLVAHRRRARSPR